ncbi:helix-turn-helix transcriptional regulator [Saccharibacillus sp. CPCC 101409]|uniref:helix-turn-helix transcriptional regulator n=1 Tax=Saccharibacillus sp. CPCC 101409 TaxID=3058041 RepID=UPI002673B64A|nr:helix-turn-helix transcriptional regulator [Saccharibacillus sp. CPCC 101409]MDO3408909.1 helix-turn-helix transcriptional regulator [Saccharibacillus sp. CPCC 101409]
MNANPRLQALSAFLKTQRAKISPESVGFPAGTRRRTPGLRREEVAQLAGVSTTWYTWLEQGRSIQASPSVLDCVASALRMNADERKYLYSLTLEGGSAAYTPESEPLRIGPSLQKIITELTCCPVIVSDRMCNIVGWNEAARCVFLDFERISADERNMIRLLFTRREFRRLAVNWEQFASGFLSMFRSYYGRYVGDGWYDRFLEEMTNAHPDFKTMWENGQVSYAPDVHLEFRHAKAGKMVYELTSLSVYGQDDLRCSVYTPSPDTTTEAKLRRLLEENRKEV